MIALPRVFSVSAPEGRQDYGLMARDVAVGTRLAYRTNSEIDGRYGKTLLSGWHEAAAVKVTFFVSCPMTEADAVKAVREAVDYLNGSLRLIGTADEILFPLITGLPLGCRLVGPAKVASNRKRPRKVAYISDFRDSVTDAWRRRVADLAALVGMDLAIANKNDDSAKNSLAREVV